MKRTITALTVSLALCAGATASADVAVGTTAPGFALPDTSGAEHALGDYRGKFVVLEWVNYQCPFVRKHYGSGNMQALQKKYTGAGVVWLAINSSAPGKQGYYPPAEAARLTAEAGSAATAYLLDTDGRVGRMYGAKTTPHMFVIDPDGTLIYQGAIDDTPTADPADIKGAVNFVDAALTAAMQGDPVRTAATPSYGCSVKY